MTFLPLDVWAHVLSCHMNTFQDVCALRLTCKDVYAAACACEKSVALWYATHYLQDAGFWEKAMRRPRATSRPLRTWHAECVRLETVRRQVHSLTATDLYQLWNYIDRRSFSQAF